MKSMKDSVFLYTDGSYFANTNRIGYGYVLVHQEAPLTALYGLVDAPTMNPYRNITGELVGASRGLVEAIGMGISKVTVVHDYNGVSQWATGRWNANNELTKNYVKFFNEISKSVQVDFLKVKGHSGDKWNDYADELSKNFLSATDNGDRYVLTLGDLKIPTFEWST